MKDAILHAAMTLNALWLLDPPAVVAQAWDVLGPLSEMANALAAAIPSTRSEWGRRS